MLKSRPLFLLLLTLIAAFTHAAPPIPRAAASLVCETSSGSPEHDAIKACTEKVLGSANQGMQCTRGLFGKTDCDAVVKCTGATITFCGPWDGSVSCQDVGNAAVEIMNNCQNTKRQAGGTYGFPGSTNTVKVHK